MHTAVAKTTQQSDICFVLIFYLFTILWIMEERERKNIKGGEGPISSSKVKVNV